MDDNEDVVQQPYNNQLMRWRWNYARMRDDGSNRILVRCIEDRYA